MSEIRIKDIINIIEKVAPLDLQAEYDNCGLKLGNKENFCKGVLVTLDLNEKVVDEAYKNGCNLIIEHHPSIFLPIYALDYRLPLHRAMVSAIKKDIAIYSAHTNIDFAENGLNTFFAKKLELIDIKAIDDDLSSGRIGKLKKEMNLKDFFDYVVLKTGDKNARYIGDEKRNVKTVALINGAGGGSVDFVSKLQEKNIDVFVTSEVKYAVARFAKDINYAIISIGHYDSEIGFIDLIKNIIEKEIFDIKIIKSKIKNPYNI